MSLEKLFWRQKPSHNFTAVAWNRLRTDIYRSLRSLTIGKKFSTTRGRRGKMLRHNQSFGFNTFTFKYWNWKGKTVNTNIFLSFIGDINTM